MLVGPAKALAKALAGRRWRSQRRNWKSTFATSVLSEIKRFAVDDRLKRFEIYLRQEINLKHAPRLNIASVFRYVVSLGFLKTL